jgi:hypothetical protein
MTTTATSKHVYAAIAQVMREMAKTGISKDRKNDAQGFKFRGIDDVLNALSRVLADHELCILPRVISRAVTERANSRGNALFYVVLEVEFDLVSARDGSAHTVRTVGEAMDSGDKATNKAMSAAYKYMAIQTFAIPTEGDNDADATTHEVASSRQNGRSAVAEEADKVRAIRDVADACIALHAAAVTQFDKDGDTAGFWELHRAASRVTGEDRMALWEMLNKHSAVRAAIKEYAGYANAEKSKVAA